MRVRWGGHEIEWLHDKVYMGYDTADIQGFNMSDGYNLLLYNVPKHDDFVCSCSISRTRQ
ncbi:MAG: hypothetical protein H0Z37_09430 [Firmicutes bacterium]|nr:hypothetical protein [Bacillota bacterium]